MDAAPAVRRRRPRRGRGEGRGRGGLSPEEQRAEERLKLLNGALDVYRKAGAALQPIELPGNPDPLFHGLELCAEQAGGRGL